VKIPAFDQAPDLARGKIGVYVDLKSASAADPMSPIDGHGITDDRTCAASSFSPRFRCS